jgi:protein-L-isoaspartate O-methyltransferase
MTPQLPQVAASSFEGLYRENPDPWNFAGSDYERSRYATTLAALSRDSYGTTFEPGCSVGELTVHLAARCSRVLAIDIAPSAVARAQRRCRDCTNVDIVCGDVAAGVPVGPFDLIVFSEIGYYFELDALRHIAAALAGRMQPQGEFIAVHWLGHSRDHVLHGDAVHELLKQCLPLQWQKGACYGGFRIDTWVHR